MSDIYDHVKYITKRHEKLSTNYPIHININRINYKNSVQKKDGYKLGLKKPKSMKLFDSTNKWIEKPI